ncbi:related to endo-1,6-beta-d-glucanase precursor [Melanopsichium pennsylvanicum]|uniref:Related to endo-1,6-beta-d-glucanase n=2 Tax=Melanopsichium pennsylvanicum TaxID=63383 RepID=A0AAJ4XKC7_9BASI|nr:related to endo-1,6-beta-d-glucanase precursor [Melanopsichium pennsylvanicum 4]SNX83944.1 related to endo-1,6-beta-d-glucanase precursor [Melanopsichium pennsylvanicum]
MPVYGAPSGRGEADLYSDKPLASGQTSPMLPISSTDRSAPGASYRTKLSVWWASQTKTRKILLVSCTAISLLALILGLALGLTLTKSSQDPSPSSDYVPATISGNRTSLLTSGSFYTAPKDGTNFVWNSTLPSLGSYRADSQGVDIIVNTTQRYQEIDGFGGALTDSSASLLSRLKTKEVELYNRVMDFMFNNATGVGITRVSMGASDFSVDQEYSYIPNPPEYDQAATELNDPDALLSSFSVEGTQSSQYTIPVLQDALKRNSNLKVILSPWSPPAFMKSNNTMNGGSLRNSSFIPLLAQYYATTADAWTKLGVRPWAMTLQNEPSNVAPYPSMGMNSTQQSQLALALKSELSQRGLGSIQIWGHDDNYSGYQSAADIVNDNSSAIDAIAFHCYRGETSQISQFASSLQNGVTKDVHMTECTGTGHPSNRWNGIQGWLSKVYWPLSLQNSKSIIQWNLALDSGHGPHLENSYCSSCTGSLTLSSQQNPANPYVQYNDQMYLNNHFSVASTDLSNVGGGKAVRVGAEQGTLYSLQSEDWQCLNWVAYAAPLSATTLQNANNTNAAQSNRRVGLVIANTCQDTKDVVISSDGRRTTLPVQEGLSTFVWTAP